MSTAIYAFSGDPITFGHIDIIRRAALIFDNLIVAIGINPDKKYLFSLDERTDLASQALVGFKNVKVVSFTGLLIDFAYEIGADVIVKGVRNPADFQYEANLCRMGDTQDIGIDTFILIAKPEKVHISSSSVKQLQQEQGLIHEFVPLNVKQALEKKISNQYIISVTGVIGSGKSFVSDRFLSLGKENNIEVHHIDLDNIAHQIYDDLDQPRYKKIRDTIIETFGLAIKGRDGYVDRKKLGDIIFGDYQKRQILDEIMSTPILVRIRRELLGKQGLILLTASLMVESELLYLSNNHVCIVEQSEKIKNQRLKKRGLSEKQILQRLDSQYSFDQKLEKAQEIIKRDSFGKIWICDNRPDFFEESIKNQFKKIVSDLEIQTTTSKL